MEDKRLDKRLDSFMEWIEKNKSEISEKNEILDSVVYIIDFSEIDVDLDKSYRKKQILELLGIEVSNDYVSYKIQDKIFGVIELVFDMDMKASKYGKWYKLKDYKLEITEPIIIGVIAYVNSYDDVDCSLAFNSSELISFYKAIVVEE